MARIASVLVSLLGFLIVLQVVTSIFGPAVLPPQLAHQLATDPEIYGVAVGLGVVALLVLGYPLCLVGAYLAVRSARQRNRRWLAKALVVISLLGMVVGLVGLIGELTVTKLLLTSVPLIIPLVSVVVVVIVTFTPAPATDDTPKAAPGSPPDKPNQPAASN